MQSKTLKDLFDERVFTVSNMLSLSRVLLLPVFLYFSHYYASNPANVEYLLYSLITLMTAVLTDYLDGLVARMLKQTSVLGRYLDPICDKITTIAGVGLIVYYFHFPIWMLVAYVIRELFAFYMGGFLYFKRGIQGKPNWWGKVGVGIVAIEVFWYMILPYHNTIDKTESWVKNPELGGYVLLFVLMGGMVSYTVRYWNIVFHPQTIKAENDIAKGKKHFSVIE